MTKKPTNTDNDSDQEKPVDRNQRDRNRKQLNPRLVFNDPDLFFDLLMEEQEEG